HDAILILLSSSLGISGYSSFSFFSFFNVFFAAITVAQTLHFFNRPMYVIHFYAIALNDMYRLSALIYTYTSL
ncbi:MAG TPA: hypothetical protein VE223_07785, partial [Nitrososphaeraceae archaeon]|nr:hypothetical protein [Nitrososphaeraceae archaeon]